MTMIRATTKVLLNPTVRSNLAAGRRSLTSLSLMSLLILPYLTMRKKRKLHGATEEGHAHRVAVKLMR